MYSLMYSLMKKLVRPTIIAALILVSLWVGSCCFAADVQQLEQEKIIGTKAHVLPHPRQIRWQERELTAFVHFTVNTFTDREWGDGAEKPSIFDPSELDVKQWVKTFKDSGMKMVIITAKHHDGFCLWPSKYTEHSVKNSPYKNGKGDVVGELEAACREAGLDFGVYLSPWDRNHADYAKAEYLSYFRSQLRELLTQYGDIAEVWFDGANGGTGYYGGANEDRRIDRKTYYDWPNTRAIVRKLQPMACMFSDAGPDCRWVGNERGFANETCWSMLRRDEFYPGCPNYKELTSGHKDGTHWVPVECDVSIPGRLTWNQKTAGIGFGEKANSYPKEMDSSFWERTLIQRKRMRSFVSYGAWEGGISEH